MALGARPGRVLRLVLGESVGMVALGVVIGLTMAAAGRLVAGQLYGVAPTDPETALGASLLMLVVASTAGYFLHAELLASIRSLRSGPSKREW